MTPRTFLVLMTAVAVISDSLLHPFYPQYFREVFGVTDSVHVGLYVAACSLTVLLTFPVWALVSRRVPVVRLLIATQVATAILAAVSFAADSLLVFWGASLAMMLFKASYLLIYPYVMSLEDKTRHPQTIGVLAFVVYFGHIASAFAAGLVFEVLGPRLLFVAMAAGDLLQTALCFLVAGSATFAQRPAPAHEGSSDASLGLPRGFLVRLGLVMFALYFSAYVTEPFFSEFWEARSGIYNRIASGVVYALPGLAALATIAIDARRSTQQGPGLGIVPIAALLVIGLGLQLFGNWMLVVVGRCLYGWALFRSMVALDLIVFRISTPDDYAVDFSRANLFQGLGVMVASMVAGSLVGHFGSSVPFLVAAAGFVVGAAFYAWRVQPAVALRENTAAMADAGPRSEALPT